MLWYRNMKMAMKILLPVGVTLVLALGLLTWQIQSRSSQATRALAERELVAVAAQHGNALQTFFEEALSATQILAQSMGGALSEGYSPPRMFLVAAMHGILKENKDFIAASMLWEPNALDGNDASAVNTPGSDSKGRFIPYVTNGSIALLTDYENSDYYTVPKKTRKSYLTEPYYYPVNGKQVLMTTAASPILVDGEFRGVGAIDITMETVSKQVASVKLYKTGLVGLVTQTGVLAGFPDASQVGKNIFRDADIPIADKAAVEQAFRAGEAYSEVALAADGDPCINYYYPINFSGTDEYWYFVVSAPLHEVLEEVDFLSRLTIGMSIGALLLVLLLIFIVVRITVKPLGILAGAAQEIAGGNLKAPIHDEHFGGEMKDLSTSFKSMIATLLENITRAERMSSDAQQQALKAQQAMEAAERAGKEAEAKTENILHAAERLEGVAQAVSSACTELSTQVDQSEQGAAQQASRTIETATAMEEMNSTVLEVSRNASQAAEVSTSTRKKAEEGADVVRRAVTSINAVHSQSQTLRNDMAALDENARSISQIMGVISDIADQTNLLALNAAIEAARAGEAGRGFAVVADEVRKLAEKTMASTADVGKAIKSIQQSVSKSMSQVDTTVTTIEEATSLADQSGVALREIVSMVDHTADQVRAIATASEQQSATADEISRSINDVSTIAGETAQAMQESARAVGDLTQQAQILTRLIDDMKRI